MVNDARYFPLLALAAAWASDAGIPRQMVLRNLCDWAMRGAFPADALVTAAEDKIDPFEVFMSRRALTADFGGGVLLDGETMHNPRWGFSLLKSVRVSAAGVRALCQSTDTNLPSLLLKNSKKRHRRAFRAKHRAPPPCPEAEEYAARHQTREWAVRTINFLRETLTGLQGKPARFGPRCSAEEASLEYWEPRWRKDVDRAQKSIDRCGDVHLQRDLHELTSEWASLAEKERQSTRAVPDYAGSAPPGCHQAGLPVGQDQEPANERREVPAPIPNAPEHPPQATEPPQIAFAVNSNGSQVVFEGGISLTGGNARIVAALLPSYLEGLKAARGSDGFRFVSAKHLAELPDITPPSMRQSIGRFRSSLSDKFRQHFALELDSNHVIENHRWRGYRLNPCLVLRPSLLDHVIKD